jgi:Bpu10I restriction endonuclease
MELKELIQKLSEIDKKLPHCSNLKTKALNENTSKGKSATLTKEIVSHYLNYFQAIKKLDKIKDPEKWITNSLKYFEVYYAEIKSDKYRIFSHQSDFLSSLLPEFLYMLYNKFVISKHKGFIIETQKDLVIDLSFLPYSTSAINFKSKRVDVAILKPCLFAVNKKKLTDFNIALVAIEVKTNLDKNMIGGVEYSVQRLKRTFPLCKYYLISELADFAYEKQNYAASAIDEILITRKQKRSEVRRDSNKLNPIDADLMFNHLKEVLQFLENVVEEPVILSKRLKKGKLIKS